VPIHGVPLAIGKFPAQSRDLLGLFANFIKRLRIRRPDRLQDDLLDLFRRMHTSLLRAGVGLQELAESFNLGHIRAVDGSMESIDG
jgi:hypothetical protein